jgi:hypothetical protein
MREEESTNFEKFECDHENVHLEEQFKDVVK